MTQPTFQRPRRRLIDFRGVPAIASLLLLAAVPASAADFTYRYFRFKTTKIKGSGSALQLSEFTFSHAGTLLNLNDREGTGTNPVVVAVTAGDADPAGGEGTLKLVDGSLDTKLYRGNALATGNEIVFAFTEPTTVDSYNFATASDSAVYDRTPVSWIVSGSNDGISWDVLDIRSDVPLINTNNTYYPGFILPAAIPPVVNQFEVRNSAAGGSSAIVLNGQSVTLDYNISNSTDWSIYHGNSVTELPAESGSLVVTPPAESTAAYTLVATRGNATPAVSTALVRTVTGGAATYSYVRYTVTGRRGGGNGLVQLSELEFFNGDSSIPENKKVVLEASNPNGRNPVDHDEGANKLFDGQANTKWLENAIDRSVIFYFGEEPVTFDRYQFITGGDAPDRDPVNWTLEGSNDESTWDLIENVNFSYPTPMARQFSSREIPLPGPSLPINIQFSGSTARMIQGESLTLTYIIPDLNLTTDTLVLTASTGETIPVPTERYHTWELFPTADTTYTLTATRAGGGAAMPTAQVSVVVVPNPDADQIAYDDFSSAGTELYALGSASITGPDASAPNRLRLTPDQGSQKGATWFMQKFDARGGFEATFGLHMNAVPNANHPPADGISFVVHNAYQGNAELGNGEMGVGENALNVSFRTYGYTPDPASLIEVRVGSAVINRCVAYDQPGVELYGLPGVAGENGEIHGEYPFSLASLASDPAYRIRVVYAPGDLDVYLDGIAVIQNADVNLGDIGAIDENGKSYFGFTARTGAYSQNNDITDWKVKFGNFSELPPFGLVKTRFKSSSAGGVPNAIDVVWNASESKRYELLRTSDLSLPRSEWQIVDEKYGVAGQIGVSYPLDSENPPAKSFFSVREIVE
jgi:hypothetical protein